MSLQVTPERNQDDLFNSIDEFEIVSTASSTADAIYSKKNIRSFSFYCSAACSWCDNPGTDAQEQSAPLLQLYAPYSKLPIVHFRLCFSEIVSH